MVIPAIGIKHVNANKKSFKISTFWHDKEAG